MNKHHSTISRRDFMKGLGLAGAGLGAAAAAAPVFHDLDELASSTPFKMHPYHRWWIKERDHEDLTTPVDWSIFERWSFSKMYRSPPDISAERKAKRNARYKEGIQTNRPGETLRDQALDGATAFIGPNTDWNGPEIKSYLFTPEQRGGPGTLPWQGTHEDNLTMCRSALHFFGTPCVGAIEVNEHTKMLLDEGAVFEDIDVAYREGGVSHIPNKCKWILVWLVRQNTAQSMYAVRGDDPDDPGRNTTFRLGIACQGQAYSHGAQIRRQAMGFLKCLGYQALKPSAMANVPFGVFAGLIEVSRPGLSCSPDYGNMIRHMDFAITDLPLAPTKPIDAGIQPFCSTCKRCAEFCPTHSITLDDEPSWDAGLNNRVGCKAWRIDWPSCADKKEIQGAAAFCCDFCQTHCPFSHIDEGLIHPLVRGIVATTSIFNSFFVTMEGAFGYAKQKSDEELIGWWSRDLNTWPYDTLLGCGQKDW